MDNENDVAFGIGQYRNLGKKTLWLFLSGKSTVSLVILLVSIFVLLASGTGGDGIKNVFGYMVNLRLIGFYGLGLFAVVAGMTFFISWLFYVTYKYMLDVDSLKVKRGIFSQEQVAIPYRQIQDVTIERSITYRLWGLSRLVILTAGHEDAKDGTGQSEGILPALDKDVAEKLQEELLRRANVQKIVEDK
ncbi:MAG: PH domain-containing protein [Patescibacteria group bacterium]|nr:PH domain-containing protein [Patescibacteria group bacterium]MDE2015109.1 PH domain-containing protein [Patescibacteria group bacterium]MDE2226537.1 PH domain-containing protein [Patescibacteria group bacterium]